MKSKDLETYIYGTQPTSDSILLKWKLYPQYVFTFALTVIINSLFLSLYLRLSLPPSTHINDYTEASHCWLKR